MGNCLEGLAPGATGTSSPAPVPGATGQRLSLGYWNIRGLAAPMRMLCAYAQLEIQDIKYDVAQRSSGRWEAVEWEKKAKPGLLEKNAFSKLPYVINQTSGEVVASFNAIMLYLGRFALLNGETWEEHLANEQVLFQINDMLKELADVVYPTKVNKDEMTFCKARDEYFKSDLPLNYKKLEDWLKQRGTEFLAAPNPCTCDFAAWELLDQNEAMADVFNRQSPLAIYPSLLQYYYRFQELPELRTYYDSDDAKLPINNKMAWFK